jgi:hypothetical protein
VIPAVALLLVAVLAWAKVRAGSTTTAVGVERAIERFDESDGRGGSAAPDLPDPGVYRYATSGFDSVDALDGARHDYPSLTTVTIRHEGCGMRRRWDVAEERWEESQLCVDPDGIRLTAQETFREFFGIAAPSTYTCTGGVRPVVAPVGTTWSGVCRDGEDHATVTAGRIVGYGTLDVDGVEVAAQHTRREVTISGSSVGTQSVDTWLVAATGLVLEEEGRTETRQSTALGTVRYEEHYTVELLSLTPLR